MTARQDSTVDMESVTTRNSLSVGRRCATSSSALRTVIVSALVEWSLVLPLVGMRQRPARTTRDVRKSISTHAPPTRLRSAYGRPCAPESLTVRDTCRSRAYGELKLSPQRHLQQRLHSSHSLSPCGLLACLSASSRAAAVHLPGVSPACASTACWNRLGCAISLAGCSPPSMGGSESNE